MHITLLTVTNRYHTTLHFAEQLGEAFRRAGTTVSMVATAEGGLTDLLDRLDHLQPDATLSFSDIQCGGGALQSMTGIPHFSYFLDPAIYFLHHRAGPLSCCDEGDLEMMRQFGCQNSSFLPAAVSGELATKIPLSKKRYDLVYVGTCFDPEEQRGRWKGLYLPPICKALANMAEQILHTPRSIWEVMGEASVPDELVLTLFHELDHYIRAVDRIALLRAMPQERLTIWGDGPWSRYLPEATAHTPIPFKEVLPLIRESKFFLSSAPRFKRGIHERIFYAFMGGSVPIVTATPPLINDYSDQFAYRPGHWEEGIMKIEQIEKDYEAVVEQGRAVTLAKHTWDHRVSYLLKQLHCGQRMSG